MAPRLPFTLDQLKQAVAANHSYVAVARQLGYSPRGSAGMVKRWIEQHGLDTSHFGGKGWHRGRGPNIVYTRETLAEAVQHSRTYSDVCRYLGRTTQGGTSTHIRRRIEAFGIDTSHFLTRSEVSRLNWRPDMRPNTPGGFRKPEDLFVVLSPGSNRPRASMLRREMIKAGIPEKCAECGQGPEWNGKPLGLHVDHIDGNWLNNLQENLRFLCPNCHSQQPTTRSTRRRHYSDRVEPFTPVCDQGHPLTGSGGCPQCRLTHRRSRTEERTGRPAQINHADRTHCPLEHELRAPNLVASCPRRSCLACRRGRGVVATAARRGEVLDLKTIADAKYAEIMAAA